MTTINELPESVSLDDEGHLEHHEVIHAGLKEHGLAISAIEEDLADKSDTGHTHTISEVVNLQTELDKKPNLVSGKLPTSVIPSIALIKTSVVANRSAMLALTAEEGDIAVITAGEDRGTYILGSGASTTFASWILLSADSTLVSVNGQTGTVVLDASDVGAATASHKHPISDITVTGTASSTTYLRGDGSWTAPPNTTYTNMTDAEANTGTSTTGRIITAAALKAAIVTHTEGKSNTGHKHSVGDITATGTASGTTFLRGDGSWSVPSTGGGGGSNDAEDITGDFTSSANVSNASVDLTAYDYGVASLSEFLFLAPKTSDLITTSPLREILYQADEATRTSQPEYARLRVEVTRYLNTVCVYGMVTTASPIWVPNDGTSLVIELPEWAEHPSMLSSSVFNEHGEICCSSKIEGPVIRFGLLSGSPEVNYGFFNFTYHVDSAWEDFI